jgi:hypothetical protein
VGVRRTGAEEQSRGDRHGGGWVTFARAALQQLALPRREDTVAKGRKTSLAVRAAALVFALALVALAARLWIVSAPRETSASRPSADAGGDAGAAARDEDDALDAVATAPPLHGEHSAEDQEALRGILRNDGGEAP